MTIIQHPLEYMSGVRLLLLASRHKDGAQKVRRINRVSNNPLHFGNILYEFTRIKQDTDRIYVSLAQRDVIKASRLLKHRMVDAEWNPHPEEFYKNLNNHWVSCLMDKSSTLKEDRLWMFDCDSELDYAQVLVELENLNVPVHYSYATKNGHHVVVKPFNRTKLSDQFSGILSDNPLMLWSY